MSSVHIPVSLRRLVHERAQGRCEYCLLPESVALAPHQVDHIVALKHGGQTESDNLALSCALCNKRKGSDLTAIDPETGEIAPLYHPRRDVWANHFRLAGAVLEPQTPAARATVRLLQLNQPDRLAERDLLARTGLLRP